MDLAPVRDLVRRRAGLDIRGTAEALFEESVASRIAEVGAGDVHDYYVRLTADEGEFYRLVELLTINETYFGRDRDQLGFFVESMVPKLLERRRGRGPVKILSAGCSSGEEIYSIGILLSERYGEAASSLFSLVGCDIDRDAVERAKAGIYRSFSFRGFDERSRGRWFEETGDGRWRIRKEIARMADFRRVNLVGTDWPPDFDDFDAIFLRNVSIYFDSETRAEMQRRLARILAETGYLIIGSAETLANDLGVLDLRSDEGNFYFVHPSNDASRSDGESRPGTPRRLASPRQVPPRLASPRTASPRNAAPRPLPPRLSPLGPVPPRHVRHAPEPVVAAPRASHSPALSVPVIRDLVRNKRYDEALSALEGAWAAYDTAEGDTAVPPTAGSAPAGQLALLRSFILLERRSYDESERFALEALEADPWSVDACVLLGLGTRRSGRADEAVAWFRRAVYSSSACWPAHFLLAELYREMGDIDKARREYRIVLHALGSPAGRAGNLAIVPLDLPAADLKLLCESRLREAPRGA